jgi:hypothetical protein
VTEATVANNSNNEVISKAGNAVMATREVKIPGGSDPTGPQINPSNKMVKVYKVLFQTMFFFLVLDCSAEIVALRRALCPVESNRHCISEIVFLYFNSKVCKSKRLPKKLPMGKKSQKCKTNLVKLPYTARKQLLRASSLIMQGCTVVTR